jgi:hypothetical protein
MMNKVAIWVGVGGLVGCGASPSTPPATPLPTEPPTATAATATPADPATPKTSKQEQFEADNLARLRALQVFTVGQLIQGQPAETFSCYGPCSRLGKLVVAAENAVTMPAPAGACEKGAIDANLAALEALQILHVEGLIVEKPKNSTSCYNNPCPGDVAAARDVTCTRAGKLANIAAAVKRL